MITLYSGNNCAACRSAKTLLSANAVEFVEVSIDNNAHAKEFLVSRGHRLIPQIYKDEAYLGGGIEGVKAYIKGLE